MFQVGATESELLNSVFNNSVINFDKLFNGADASNFAMYTGSLTTPPCHENVSWYILEFP